MLSVDCAKEPADFNLCHEDLFITLRILRFTIDMYWTNVRQINDLFLSLLILQCSFNKKN